MESVALPQGRERQERASVETARSQLASQRSVEIGRTGAIGRSAQSRPAVAALVVAAARQIQLAILSSVTGSALASVTAFFT